MNNNYNEPRRHGETLDTDDQANRDPITGTPGSHPVGTALGAAPAAMAGTVVGAAVGGPVGAVVGAAAGAIAGGAVGHQAAEAANPTLLDGDPPHPALAGLRTELEEEHRARELTLGTQRPFDKHVDAYSLGVNERLAAQQRLEQDPSMPLDWDDRLEARLRKGWETTRTDMNQAWDDVKMSVKSAWAATGRRLDGRDRRV